ncbi:MAG TPA: sugar phosphate isomerase/epimerase [Thermomicrobiaceae bacterium]|nr:sugar phosphate isomerase/epimerase [Thermomicrobiaceae bacterium]
MDISVSTGSLTGIRLPVAFEMAKRAGADGVELMLTARIVEQGVDRVRAVEHASGVPVLTAHTIMRIGRTAPAIMARDILSSAEFARSLPDCAALVVHTPMTSTLHNVEAKSWLRAIEYAHDLGERTGLRVAVENVGRLSASDPTGYLDHPERLRRLAQEWDVAVAFDTAHAASRDWDLLAAVDKLGPHLANVHLSDYARHDFRIALVNAFFRDHQLPGTGTLALSRVIGRLAANGYDGPITLELSPIALGVPVRRVVESRLRRAVSFCRDVARAGVPQRHGSGRPGLP